MPSGAFATSGPGSGPAGPYDGTPAATFAVGAAGFALPEAHAVKGWSAKEVADGLAQVKAALVAAYLDRRMLVDHDPDGLVRLLAPAVRTDATRGINTGRYGTDVVRLASGETLAAEPRVNGRTTYRAIQRNGLPALEIITNYVIAYAFEGPSTYPGDRVVVVHSEAHWRLFTTDRIARDERGLRLGESEGYWFNNSCAASEQGFTAPPAAVEPSQRPDVVSTESPDAYYQFDHTLAIGSGCLQ